MARGMPVRFMLNEDSAISFKVEVYSHVQIQKSHLGSGGVHFDGSIWTFDGTERNSILLVPFFSMDSSLWHGNLLTPRRAVCETVADFHDRALVRLKYRRKNATRLWTDPDQGSSPEGFIDENKSDFDDFDPRLRFFAAGIGPA